MVVQFHPPFPLEQFPFAFNVSWSMVILGGDEQLHGIVSGFTKPLKLKVKDPVVFFVQAVFGTAIFTCTVWPGVMVPLAGVMKYIPDAPLVDTDQSRVPGFFWPVFNTVVQTQTWPSLPPSQSLFTLKLPGLTFTLQFCSTPVQLHGTSILFSGPVKVKAPEFWQSALGIEIETRIPLWPGDSVPPGGSNFTPDNPVFADQSRLPRESVVSWSVIVQFQPISVGVQLLVSFAERLFGMGVNIRCCEQYQVTSALLFSPCPAKVNTLSLQALFGIRIVTNFDPPGGTVPFEGVKITPSNPVCVDQSKLL